MKKVVLRNGLTLILRKTDSNSVTFGVCVKTGSNNEDMNNRGVSHFIEHMVFEGTKKRTSQEIVRAIEKVGGEFNAFTDNEITFYYAKVPSRFFQRALDVISDMLENSIFDEKTIDKERKVIIEEINLWNDDPKAYQWELFQKTVYKNHPARFPVIGFKDTLKKTKRKDILKYYNKYYAPNNMIVIITGNFPDNAETDIKNYFGNLKPKKIQEKKFKEEKKQNKIIKRKEKKEVAHSYLIIGYNTVNRSHPDSYVLDVLSVILGMGQSSRLFNEIRMKRGLSYNLGMQHDCNKTFGYIGAFVNTDHKNIEQCRNLILQEFKLNNLTDKEVEEAKNMVEGLLLLRNEDTKELAMSLGRWEFFGKAENFYDYVTRIRKVTKEDVLRIAEKYLNKNYTEILIYK